MRRIIVWGVLLLLVGLVVAVTAHDELARNLGRLLTLAGDVLLVCGVYRLARMRDDNA